MAPADLLDDHLRRPRNIGKMPNAGAVGDIGSIVAGDALRFYIAVEGERITAARFQVFNAGDQIAAASATTELAVGLTLERAAALTPLDLCHFFGGLDRVLLPPQIWGLEGLRAAIATWRGQAPAGDEEQPQAAALLCRCHGIAEETVRQSIQAMNLDSVDGVVAATGAGTGCGSCKADIPALIDEAKGRAAEPAAAPRAAAAGRLGLARRARQVLESRIVPKARAAGGALEAWDFDGRVLTLAASGALAADGEARRALLAELEAALKAEVDPSLGVALRG